MCLVWDVVVLVLLIWVDVCNLVLFYGVFIVFKLVVMLLLVWEMFVYCGWLLCLCIGMFM